MAQLTAVLQPVDPVSLREHAGGDAVAALTRARKFFLGWNLYEGVPVVRRINLCCLDRACSGLRIERHGLARSAGFLLRVQQTVTAYPHLVARRWQVGYQKLPCII